MHAEHLEPGSEVPVSAAISRVVAVINPLSGGGLDPRAAATRTALVHEVCGRHGLTATVHITERGGHARELAAAAAASDANLVIVWGGDGTVNEAGSALVGSRTALALVPAGSGNGLAASLCVPRGSRAALEHLIAAPVRSIDVGFLGDRPFFNIAGIGLDAHIASEFNRRPRGRRGKWPYVSIGVRAGLRYRALDYLLDFDGQSSTATALLVAFANGAEYGMGACLSPGAKLDDGVLEATVVEDRSALARFIDARHLALRTIARAPKVRSARIRRGSVSCKSGPMLYHVDGEPGLALERLEVRIEPAALRVKA
ncbi:MAG: diacylglycerol kinase family protein [Vicinamibacterales bacterium]